MLYNLTLNIHIMSIFNVYIMTSPILFLLYKTVEVQRGDIEVGRYNSAVILWHTYSQFSHKWREYQTILLWETSKSKLSVDCSVCFGKDFTSEF